MLMAAMADRLPEDKPWQWLSIQVQLIRPVMQDQAVEAQAALLRAGGRAGFTEASLFQNGKITAKAQAAFAVPRDLPDFPGQAALTMPDPAEGQPLWPFRPKFVQGTWMGDVCAFRRGEDGILWVRFEQPLMEPLEPAVLVAALADWSTGPHKPDGHEEPVIAAFPNADLSVHFLRQPDLDPWPGQEGGGWVGLRGQADWHRNGLGGTYTELFDRQGLLGHCVQSVVLST